MKFDLTNFNKREARTMSRMGMRANYGAFLLDLARQNKNILATSADLGRSSGLDRFSKELGDQFFNVGISEQALVGFSSGLAREGFDVFASTFAPFATMRAGEFVRMNMSYMQEPLKLVGLASGVSLGFLGNSHFGLEDVAIMRSMPNITILSPADCFEMRKMLLACVGKRDPVYIRLTGSINCPVSYEADYELKVGHSVQLHDGKDTCVISTGAVTGNCLAAVRRLSQEGNSITHINMHTISPINQAEIINLFEKYKKIFVVEEHRLSGGLGSAILEVAHENMLDTRKLMCIGLPNNFLNSGSYDHLLKMYKLDETGLFQVLGA
jgi:transketolase